LYAGIAGWSGPVSFLQLISVLCYSVTRAAANVLSAVIAGWSQPMSIMTVNVTMTEMMQQSTYETRGNSSYANIGFHSVSPTAL